MSRRFLTPGWLFGHVLVVASVLLTLRLGWWQLERSHESTGGAQNFGYALLWPAFGAAFIYMWSRFLKLETLRAEGEEEAHAADVSSMLAEAEGLTAAAAQASASPTQAAATPTAADPMATQIPVSQKNHLQTIHTEPAPVPVIGMGTVGDEDNDDPELIAYNRALAALAEQDHRRAR
ncbi:hypothetical protein EH165_05650 [Nakamurella antarctica]|uniref:DNA-binding transcriptional regulator of glucitol operon n=1 Tax=Nakamurella antarctica TaxID=1902245 RepID=A0A3G8ZKH8_9ACTN|nr:hypothetical protein [Nakamurella antarctica]AZI57710.1 hypothetical protein EH165_05650 [Nakamurella antarctica]